MTAPAHIIQGDARRLPLPDESVDLIVTSPPYFGLRSYRDGGEHYEGQIGSEATPAEFVDALMECMIEWRRVLKPSGSVFVNLDDKMVSGAPGTTVGSTLQGANQQQRTGAERSRLRTYPKPANVRQKSRIGVPWRFAIAAIDDGWILRAEIIWSKSNGMPESVTDRVRKSHETWFHFVKEPRYYSAVDELREEPREPLRAYVRMSKAGKAARDGRMSAGTGMQPHTLAADQSVHPLGRLPGSVWEIPTEGLVVPEAIRKARGLPEHFAAFPQEWPRRLIVGWSPPAICTVCNEGLRPVVEVDQEPYREATSNGTRKTGGFNSEGYPQTNRRTTISGYACACDEPGPTRPAVVLDPFSGTGTTVGVARALGRIGIGVDMSADYCRLARWRVFESGHFAKTEQRMWSDRQDTLFGEVV